jgi:hypothetical protein
VLDEGVKKSLEISRMLSELLPNTDSVTEDPPDDFAADADD